MTERGCTGATTKEAILYETAQIILRENENGIPDIKIDERLKEMNFGSWEGLGLTKENFEIPSKDFNLFYTDPFKFINSETGESIFEVCQRTGEFYQELIHNPEHKDNNLVDNTWICVKSYAVAGI